MGIDESVFLSVLRDVMKLNFITIFCVSGGNSDTRLHKRIEIRCRLWKFITVKPFPDKLKFSTFAIYIRLRYI